MSDPARKHDAALEAGDTEFLLETSRELSSSLEVATILSRISRRILDVLPATRSGVLLVDDTGERILLVAGHTLERDAVPRAAGSPERVLDPRLYPEVAAARRGRQPVIIEDIRSHPLLQPVRKLVSSAGLRSLLVVPLLCKERFLGVISIGEFGTVRTFARREIALCQTLANQAAIALENARLYARVRDWNASLEKTVEERTSRLERAYLQLSLIHGIAERITEAYEVDEVLEKAATLLQSSFHYYGVTVLVEDPRSSELVVRGVACDRARTAKRMRGHRLPVGEGIAGWVFRHGEPRVVNDVWRDPDYVEAGLGACRSELCVPIRIDGRTVAVLDVQSRREGAFTDQDRIALETLAETLSVAITNARLFAELRDGKQFTEEIIQNLSGGLLVVDRAGVLRRLNHKGAEILRIAPEEILGRRLTEIFPASDALLRYAPGEIGREMEIALPGGASVPIGYSNSFFASSTGGMDGVIVSFRDLSEIRALRRELRAKERLATIGQVAAGVAHEIRNPLFGITSAAQMIERETGGSPDIVALVRGMISETRRLNRLVEDLLLFGRAPEPRRTDTALLALWKEILDLQGSLAHAAGTRVAIRFRDEGKARLDPGGIKQVMLNLFRNAVEASPGGRVTITGGKAGRGVWFRVRDDGPGLDEKGRERLFEPFHTTKEGGNGLGLPLARKIVEDHGGTIAVESNPGAGTAFTVRLPASEDTSDERTP